MTAVLIPPARVGGPMAGPPSSWPLSAFEWYSERAGIREAAGESPVEASRNAEQDIRRWCENYGSEWLWDRHRNRSDER
jgi:hypothetical protein